MNLSKVTTLRLYPWHYHLLFWMGYTLFWHSIFSPNLWSLYGLITSIIYTLVHAVASYLNIEILIPRFSPIRSIAYLFSIVIIILLAAGLLGICLYFWFSYLGGQPSHFFKDQQLAIGSTLGSTFSAVMLTMGIFLLRQKKDLEQRQQQLEQEQLHSELQLLRQQLDPHFLFNALNNIYFLIKKNPDEAAEALAGFSELLRYQLYQAQTDKITLQAEFDYLQQYTELAQLRLNTIEGIHVQLKPADKQYQIPPLLLLPLVENAFKHVDKDSPSICINGTVHAHELQFTVRNNQEKPIPVNAQHPKPASGIGLDNLRKRLELIYPSKYHLNIQQEEGTYTVNLNIQLL